MRMTCCVSSLLLVVPVPLKTKVPMSEMVMALVRQLVASHRESVPRVDRVQLPCGPSLVHPLDEHLSFRMLLRLL